MESVDFWILRVVDCILKSFIVIASNNTRDSIAMVRNFNLDFGNTYVLLWFLVAIPGTWYREIYFYSPTVGHFFLTALLFLSIRLWRDSIPKERVTFVNDIPDFGKPSDADTFDILYPAARKARQPTPPPPDPQPPRADQEPIVLVAPTTASPQVAQQLIIQEVAKLCREIEPRQRGSKRRNTTEEN